MTETPNGAPAPAAPANAVPAPSTQVVQPNSVDTDRDVPDDDEPVAKMADYRRLRRKHGELQAQLREIQERQEAEKNKAHWDEFEALKQFKANAETQAKEAAREAIRTRNVDAILSDVKQERRDEIVVLLAGMQALGKIDLYNEAEGAGLKLREKLGKDNPGWFSAAPNGAGVGLPGVPGQGLPPGPLLSHDSSVIDQMSDEAFMARYRGGGSGGARP